MSKHITSRIAMCYNCDWRCEENLPSTHTKASLHAKANKHRTCVEVASSYSYGEKPNQNEQGRR